MESGQGEIDFTLKKRLKKPDVQVNTDDPGLKIIFLEPRITWQKKPLPTKLPLQGQHGGIAMKKHYFKDQNSVDKIKGTENMEIYVLDTGYGTGGIVVCGTGSVLIGGGSLMSLTSICLPWIVVLLIMTAIFWVVRNALSGRSQRNIENGSIRYSEKSEGWIEGKIETNQQSTGRSLLLLKDDMELIKGSSNAESFRIYEPEPLQSKIMSISSYSPSAINSILKYAKSSSQKNASNASILSFSTTIFGSDVCRSQNTQCGLRKNQIVILPENGHIFTVSEKSSPNAYLKQNLSEIDFFEPSMYWDCEEILLVCQGTIVVGKMKNNHSRNKDISPFVAKIWSADSGRLCDDDQYGLACISICSFRDVYLLVLNENGLSVLDIKSNKMIAQIQTSFTKERFSGNLVAMQTAENQNYIIISDVKFQEVEIYVLSCDSILQGLSQAETYANRVTCYAPMSNCQLILAQHSTDIIVWDYARNSHTLVVRNPDQDVQRLECSPGSELVLFQLLIKITIYETSSWTSIFNIPISSGQVCATAFSSYYGMYNYFAVVLDNGQIQIFERNLWQLTRVDTTDKPVTYLTFDDTEPLLFILSDRASRNQIRAVSVS